MSYLMRWCWVFHTVQQPVRWNFVHEPEYNTKYTFARCVDPQVYNSRNSCQNSGYSVCMCMHVLNGEKNKACGTMTTLMPWWIRIDHLKQQQWRSDVWSVIFYTQQHVCQCVDNSLTFQVPIQQSSLEFCLPSHQQHDPNRHKHHRLSAWVSSHMVRYSKWILPSTPWHNVQLDCMLTQFNHNPSYVDIDLPVTSSDGSTSFFREVCHTVLLYLLLPANTTKV